MKSRNLYLHVAEQAVDRDMEKQHDYYSRFVKVVDFAKVGDCSFPAVTVGDTYLGADSSLEVVRD